MDSAALGASRSAAVLLFSVGTARLLLGLPLPHLPSDCADESPPHCPRAFYEGNYATIKKLNPRLPFIIRAAEGKDPYIIARYGTWNWPERSQLR